MSITLLIILHPALVALFCSNQLCSDYTNTWVCTGLWSLHELQQSTLGETYVRLIAVDINSDMMCNKMLTIVDLTAMTVINSDFLNVKLSSF